MLVVFVMSGEDFTQCHRLPIVEIGAGAPYLHQRGRVKNPMGERYRLLASRRPGPSPGEGMRIVALSGSAGRTPHKAKTQTPTIAVSATDPTINRFLNNSSLHYLMLKTTIALTTILAGECAVSRFSSPVDSLLVELFINGCWQAIRTAAGTSSADPALPDGSPHADSAPADTRKYPPLVRHTTVGHCPYMSV